MAKLTIADLQKIKEKAERTRHLREGGMRAKVVVHMGTCGIASGARPVLQRLMELVEKENITDVALTTSGCAGLCSSEPMMTIEIAGEGPVKYVKLDPDKAEEVFRTHVLGGEVVTKYVLARGQEKAY